MKWETKDKLRKGGFILFLVVWGLTLGYFFTNCQDTPIINF